MHHFGMVNSTTNQSSLRALPPGGGRPRTQTRGFRVQVFFRGGLRKRYHPYRFESGYCVYIYIYIYTYTQEGVCVYIYTFINKEYLLIHTICIYIYMVTYIYIWLYIYIRVYIWLNIYIYTWLYDICLYIYLVI
jgi:hypothetical protein